MRMQADTMVARRVPSRSADGAHSKTRRETRHPGPPRGLRAAPAPTADTQ